MSVEGLGQPFEMPGVLLHGILSGVLALGHMRFESGASLGASLGIWYRPMRLMPGSESGKKEKYSLRFPRCCGNFRCLLVILVQQRVQGMLHEVINNKINIMSLNNK